jgi:ribosomal protein S18 acetylase RimI-like enzyme
MARLVAMPGASALIAASQGEPCAFVIVRKAADEAEILTLGTRPFARRRGAARSLINALNTSLLHNGTKSLFIEVAASNEAALRLYQSLGFIAAGNRRRYYEIPGGTPEDAIVMRRDLTS